MIDEDVLAQITIALPFMASAPPGFIADMKDHALKLAFPAGKQILHETDRCQYLPLVLSGDLRVYRTHSSGREVTLYHIGRGESCFLTMNCIFLNQLFPASARAEEYSEALMIPAAAMQRWQENYPFWQKYIFEVAASRLISVISVLSDIAFARMDERVGQYLNQRWRETGQTELPVTHQEIANELGTAREVVTRVLRSLEEQGTLSLTRGNIRLINPGKLAG
ncbi:MAG: Crp/Fnr family transcriptional regulator [Spirochaetota bacterium]